MPGARWLPTASTSCNKLAKGLPTTSDIFARGLPPRTTFVNYEYVPVKKINFKVLKKQHMVLK
jgi:hypothetical protein